MKKVNIKEVERVSYSYAEKYLSYSEKIPAFNTRFKNVLESCVSVPFQEFGGKSKYNGLVPKASILFYLMIKNHPFQNGNKRIAMATMLWFLYKNGKWIKIDPIKLYDFAIWVACSPATAKDSAVSAVQVFLGKNIVDIKKLKKRIVK